MNFKSRTYWHPKSREFTNEYEDAFAIGDNLGAIADGVSSAIYSRQWADILTLGLVAGPPDLGDPGSFERWLAENRARWVQAIDFSKMSFFQKQKLQEVGGAYSTLLWFELYRLDSREAPAEGAEHLDSEEPVEEDSAPPAEFTYRCVAMGDCCLFHLREGKLLRRFPLESVEEFDADPVTVCSVNRNRDHHLEFHILEETCQAGDLLVLSSDALAKWIYQQYDAEEEVDWRRLASMSSREWTAFVAECREMGSGRRMRVDDTTVSFYEIHAEECTADDQVVVAPCDPLAPEESAETIVPDEAESAPEEVDANRTTHEPPQECASADAFEQVPADAELVPSIEEEDSAEAAGDSAELGETSESAVDMAGEADSSSADRLVDEPTATDEEPVARSTPNAAQE